MPKISIVVPVYNVRDLLPACVASIRAQTFRDFECVLVDDGATDGSGKLCDELAAEDSRFSAIHKSNGGLSDARNAGLEKVSGDYIMFVDSDDRLTPDALGVLIGAAERDGWDVTVGKVRLHDMRTGEERLYAPLSTPHPKNILDKLFNVAAWNKLYRRSVFATRRYTKGIKFEDMPVWADILFSGLKIGFVDDVVYIYNVNRAGSIVTTRDYRGYPASWSCFLEALRKSGNYDAATAADFVARVTMKFIQAFNLSGSASRKEFYALSQAFFRSCGKVGLSRERGKALALAAYLHYCAICALPYFVYSVVFMPERLISCSYLNAILRRRLQK